MTHLPGQLPLTTSAAARRVDNSAPRHSTAALPGSTHRHYRVTLVATAPQPRRPPRPLRGAPQPRLLTTAAASHPLAPAPHATTPYPRHGTEHHRAHPHFTPQPPVTTRHERAVHHTSSAQQRTRPRRRTTRPLPAPTSPDSRHSHHPLATPALPPPAPRLINNAQLDAPRRATARLHGPQGNTQTLPPVTRQIDAQPPTHAQRHATTNHRARSRDETQLHRRRRHTAALTCIPSHMDAAHTSAARQPNTHRSDSASPTRLRGSTTLQRCADRLVPNSSNSAHHAQRQHTEQSTTHRYAPHDARPRTTNHNHHPHPTHDSSSQHRTHSTAQHRSSLPRDCDTSSAAPPHQRDPIAPYRTRRPARGTPTGCPTTDHRAPRRLADPHRASPTNTSLVAAGLHRAPHHSQHYSTSAPSTTRHTAAAQDAAPHRIAAPHRPARLHTCTFPRR